MKLAQIYEGVTQDQMMKFQEWQRACRRVSPNSQFAGSVGMGAQAVDWTTVNNEVVGDWDYATMSGVVYKPGSLGKEVVDTI